MSRIAVAVAVAAALGAACSKSEKSEGTPAAKPPTEPAPGAGTVAVFVDDQPVATIDAAKLATWPRLDGIVPVAAQRLGTWESLAVKGAKDEVLTAPADRFPSLIPALYPGPGGPSLGMFDIIELTKKTAPKVTFAGVRELRVKLLADSDRGLNEEGSKDAFDPAKLIIAIEGGPQPQLTGTQIIELPRDTPPNGDTATTGWTLVSLLRAAGIEKPKSLLLTDEHGATLTLTAAQLDPATSVPYVKLNRQGALRFRMYTKQNDGWALGGALRGIASIKVTK
jgi:hypothetical protein